MTRKRFKNTLSAVAIGAVSIVAVPAQADTEKAVACENQGGRYVDGECEKASSSGEMDLFGKLVLLALLLTAAGAAGGSSN